MIDEYPGCHHYVKARGDILYALERFEDAKFEYHRSVSIVPTVDAYIAAAQCYIKLDDIDPAIMYFTYALRLDKDCIGAYMGRAQYGLFLCSF